MSLGVLLVVVGVVALAQQGPLQVIKVQKHTLPPMPGGHESAGSMW